MKKYIIYTIILLLNLNTFGQYQIKGTIKDSKTKENLVGASVYIPKTKQGCITDFEGNFTLKNITLQDVKVIISYESYKDKHINVHFDKAVKNISIFLDESPFELDEVIVSTGLNKLQKDNVMKVSHRSTKAMKRSGTQNLMDGIKQIPGVSALSTGTAISKPVIRGLTGNRVLVYNQGVRLENYQFGEEHGMGIDASGISAVEVIKGPASLLYGSDALGGVVYLVPEKFAPANKTRYHFGTQMFSNTLGFHSTAGIKTSTAHWQYLARGAYSLNADYKIPSNNAAINSANHSQDIKLGIGYKKNKQTTDVRYNYNHRINGMPHSFDTVPVQYKNVGTYQDLYSHNLSLKNEIKFANSKLKTNIGFSRFTRQLIHNSTTHIGMNLNTISGDFKWYAPKTKHLDWILGTQLMWQSNHNFGEHYLLPEAGVRNAAVFTNLNLDYDKYIIQGGIRYDFRHIHTETINPSRQGFDKDLGSLTGSLGGKVELNDKMNFRLNIASGFRAPNLAELTSNGEHENKIEIGDNGLKNEQNMQADMNWDYSNSHIEFFVNGFYNRINHYIYLQPLTYLSTMLPVYKYVQDNARLYGGEAGLHFHPHPLDWLHINSSYETVIGKLQDNSYLPLIPADQWKNELRITKKLKNQKKGLLYFYTQINHHFEARHNEYEEIYKPYTLINSGFGAEFQYNKMQVNLYLSAHNLTNKKYISNLSVLREDNIPNPGRNIILGMDIHW